MILGPTKIHTSKRRYFLFHYKGENKKRYAYGTLWISATEFPSSKYLKAEANKKDGNADLSFVILDFNEFKSKEDFDNFKAKEESQNV